jgi:hypothetical protein
MKIFDNYINFLTNKPFIVILITILLTIFSLSQIGNIGNKEIVMKEILPSDLEKVEVFDIVEDEFSSTKSVIITIQLDPSKYSNINDMRDPLVLEYEYILTQEISKLNEVISAESLATILKENNNNHLPKSIIEVNNLIQSNTQSSRYINSDYSLSVIRIVVEEKYDVSSMILEIEKNIEYLNKPYGISIGITGEEVSQNKVLEDLDSDMTSTAIISMIGIIIVLLLIFRSLFYGLSPLLSIVFGILWAFGIVAIIGMKMSSATSGVISMIMGIGIDFGIQTLSRFKQELAENANPVLAMQITMKSVFTPMLTTTIAGVIGFQAMTLGNLSVLADMGIMMTYGIICCFLAAITIVPALVLVYEKYVKN